jgi:GTP-binding protein HflX
MTTGRSWRFWTGGHEPSKEVSIPRVQGNLQGLRPSDHRRLQRLYHRRVSPRQVLSPELARQMAEISEEIGRQVGLLLDRRGLVFMVLVGDDHKLEIPSLQGFRQAATRLLGLRLVHTHLKGESLTQDDLSDLAHLRLDLICQVQVGQDGQPGRVQLAHLLPPNPRNQQWVLMEVENPYRLDLDALALVEGLEDEFARILRARRVDQKGERVILVGVYPAGGKKATASMAELRELARSSGLHVLDEVVQVRQQPDPRFVLGKGKLEELVIRSKQLGAEVLLFDRNLNPGQLRNLSELTDQKIIDRTQLILDIFAQHAHSRDGKIQVELAQLRYLLPRLVGKGTAMSRLRGGIGLRGPGETKLEVDRRRVRDRIARLERELEEVRKARIQRRARRSSKGLPVVSIVGYTNAGKSTLLNGLTHSQVLAEDKLFATLDPASRRLRFPKERDVIVTDTVGFIQDLPADLVNAFRATLEELEDADLLLHVADISSQYVEEQISSVRGILWEMGLGGKKELLVFNKKDLVDSWRVREMLSKHQGVAVSALRGEGLEELSQKVASLLFREGGIVSSRTEAAGGQERQMGSGSPAL